jgi:hypothetical protein
MSTQTELADKLDHLVQGGGALLTVHVPKELLIWTSMALRSASLNHIPADVVAMNAEQAKTIKAAKQLLVDLHRDVPRSRALIEARTGGWFVWGVDRDQKPEGTT